MEHIQHRPKHNGAVAQNAKLFSALRSFLDFDELEDLVVAEFFKQFGPVELSKQSFVDTLLPRGDASRMAVDVEKSLIKVIAQHG